MGSHMARTLIANHVNPILFDIAPNTKRIQDLAGKTKIVRGDLTVLSELLDVMKANEVDCIFHYGATISAAADTRPIASHRINYEGTINVLEAARLSGVKRVIYASSMAIYKPTTGTAVTEDHEKWPPSTYGVSKVFSELWGQFYASRYGLDFRALRFPTLIGPGREWSTFAFASFIIQKAALGETFDVPVRPDFRTPIAYVKDAAGAAMNLYRVERVASPAYNVPSMYPSAQEIVAEVKNQLPDASLRFVLDEGLAGMAEARNPAPLDGSRIRQDLDFTLSYDLKGTVTDFIGEIRDHRVLYA